MADTEMSPVTVLRYSVNAASYLAPRVQSYLSSIFTQWNVVVVIIKCKYLVYPPTCFDIYFRLAIEVNFKLV